MCSNCNINKCNCNNKPEFCGCKTKLDLLCSVYTGDNLELLDINKWDSANTAFEKINTFLNSVQEPDPLLIENIGNGSDVFKGISDEYKYQFKSIVQGDGILITNQDDTLTISVDSGLKSIQEGVGITIDNTDPDNPIINVDSEFSNVVTEEFVVTSGAGSFNPGDTFPGGLTLAEAFKALLTDVFEPTFPTNVGYSLSNNSNNWEIGSNQTLILTSSFNRGQIKGNYHDGTWFPNEINPRAGLPYSHVIDDTTYNTTNTTQTKSISIVVPATPTTYYSTVNYGIGMQPKDSQGDDFGAPYPEGSMSASTSIVGGLRTYAGPINSIPTTGAQIRTALLGTSVVNRSNTFSYTIGTTTPFYVIAVPAGRILDSVITGNFENQTSLFVKSTTIIQLPDFAGVNRPYNVYIADLGDPFTDLVVANVTLKNG